LARHLKDICTFSPLTLRLERRAAGRLLNFDIPASTRPNRLITIRVIPTGQRKAQVEVVEEP
jgi:hypothetical protein